MSGGQGKIFSILGPKLSGSKAQQYYRDKLLKICVEMTDYHIPYYDDSLAIIQSKTTMTTNDVNYRGKRSRQTELRKIKEIVPWSFYSKRIRNKE